jgi:Cys-tRNA(Pro)/Cys-tRNA(Cys) deacylase
VPTAFEISACGAEKVWINAGARGLLLGISPVEALQVTGGKAAPLLA